MIIQEEGTYFDSIFTQMARLIHFFQQYQMRRSEYVEQLIFIDPIQHLSDFQWFAATLKNWLTIVPSLSAF